MIRLGLAPPRLALLSLDLHCAMQLLPIAIQPLGSSPARSLPKQAFNGLRQQTVCTEIPIASNAPPRHTSRGFLPWRFAYAGPRVRRTTFTGPPSANLHKLRRTQCEHMFSALPSNSDIALYLRPFSIGPNKAHLRTYRSREQVWVQEKPVWALPCVFRG